MDSIGLRIQSQIYRAGVFGHRPVVPVEPAALAEAAHRRMTPEAWSYVAGRRRPAAHRRRPTSRPSTGTGSCRGCWSTSASATSAWTCSADGCRRPCCSPRSGCSRWRTATPSTRSPAPPASSGCRWCSPRRARSRWRTWPATWATSPRWYQLYWSSNDELVESLVSRAEAIGSDAIVVTLDTHVLGWRTHDLDLAYLPFARGAGIAQYTSDPVFRRLVEEHAAQGARPRRAATTLAAVRAVVSMAQHWPGGLLDNLRSPLPRAAVETFLDVFSRSDPHLGRPRVAARAHRSADRAQGHPGPPRRAARPRPRHRRDPRVATTAAARSTAPSARSRRCPAIAEVVGDRVPVLFDSGVRSGGDVFKALALGATAVLLGRPWVYGLALPARTACAASPSTSGRARPHHGAVRREVDRGDRARPAHHLSTPGRRT